MDYTVTSVTICDWKCKYIELAYIYNTDTSIVNWSHLKRTGNEKRTSKSKVPMTIT